MLHTYIHTNIKESRFKENVIDMSNFPKYSLQYFSEPKSMMRYEIQFLSTDINTSRKFFAKCYLLDRFLP